MLLKTRSPPLQRNSTAETILCKILEKTLRKVSHDSAIFELIIKIDIDNESLSKRKKSANTALNIVGGLEVICKVLYNLVDQLNAVDRQKFETQHQLE